MAQIIQIDSHTWRFEDGFVRFFLLEGEELALMIDSGINSPDALSLARTLTDRPIKLVNTHGDRDHISGTGAFASIGMHPLDHVNCGVESAFPDTALEEINDGDVINLGGRSLKAVFIPGHTAGSLAFIDVENRVLYSGDSVQKGHIYMFGKHRSPEEFEASLDKLIAMKDEYDLIYPSHDEPCLSADHACKVRDVWKQVCNEEIPYEITELFGIRVRSYTTDVCGFYMPIAR